MTREPDDDERLDSLVLGYFWKNSRPKFKYIIIVANCSKAMM